MYVRFTKNHEILGNENDWRVVENMFGVFLMGTMQKSDVTIYVEIKSKGQEAL